MPDFSDLLFDLVTFVFLVLVHWGGYVTGGLLVALLFVLEKVWGFSPSRGLYVNVFVIGFLFVAFFMVWREEYVMNKPTLVAEVKRTVFAKDRDGDDKGDLIALALIQVRNNGDVPKMIENFRVTYTSANGDMILKRGLFYPTAGQKLSLPDGRTRTIKPEDTLLGKMAGSISPHGGFIIGEALFRLPGSEEGRLKDAEITYCFDDTKGYAYCVSDKLPELLPPSTPLPDFPGEIPHFDESPSR